MIFLYVKLPQQEFAFVELVVDEYAGLITCDGLDGILRFVSSFIESIRAAQCR